MQRAAAACELTGIPALHAEAFQEVADATGCMISSRAVGKYATGLILEGYASKGFHNKAKSCNWGPMAGFVLNDPRFTKVGGTTAGQAGQAKALNQAFGCGAMGVPLFISDARRQWLEQQHLVALRTSSATERSYRAASPWGTLMKFTLRLEKPPGSATQMWGVYYHRDEAAGARQQQQRYSGEAESGMFYVMAMRDPQCVLRITDPKAATTGDYDLFAIFARAKRYEPDRLDKRMVGVRDLEANIKAGRPAGEDPHEGNKTLRIGMIKGMLNGAIRRRGYTGGSMVHHSDEGGRPFVEDVDLPVFAVVPGQKDCFGLESVEDMREFISVVLGREYAPVFNPGWMKQLVFHSNKTIANQIHAELLAAIAHRR
jgi:hypothetical protein